MQLHGYMCLFLYDMSYPDRRINMSLDAPITRLQVQISRDGQLSMLVLIQRKQNQ